MKSEKSTLKKPKSLNLTLWLSFSFFALFSILFVGVICYFIVENSFASFMRDKVSSVGVTVSEQISLVSADDEAESSMLAEFIERQAMEKGVNIAVITPDGEIIVPRAVNEGQKRFWSGIESTVQSKLEKSGGRVFFLSGSTYYFADYTEYGAQNNVSNYLVVGYSLDAVNNAIVAVQRSIIIVGLIVVLLSFLIAYSVSRKISDPLQSLTATAGKMAKGDYNVKFASAEYNEIAQLSDTLNYACAEIKKTDKLQKDLLANVSHDLKTPLTMIKAYASMVKEISGDDPVKREKHLQVIIDESDRLAGLVNDVLKVSKLNSDIDKINKKVFNLTEYLYGILRKFEYLQELHGYKFIEDISPDLYTCADEEKIGQALYNLISNAVNYTGEDKTVYVTLKPAEGEGRIKFSVRDTGKGIAEEDLPAIWDRYYRVKENHARPVKGTGLGLSIVKTVLEKHSFEFGATSKLGEGSEFWIDFPRVPETPPNIPEGHSEDNTVK